MAVQILIVAFMSAVLNLRSHRVENQAIEAGGECQGFSKLMGTT